MGDYLRKINEIKNLSFEEEKERVRGTLGNLRQEIERMEELDVMISLARDCIDYLNERIKEKE